MRSSVSSELVESPSCPLRLGASRSEYLNKPAERIPALLAKRAGMTTFAITNGTEKPRTPFGAVFQPFLLQTPRQMAYFAFCFASSKAQP